MIDGMRPKLPDTPAAAHCAVCGADIVPGQAKSAETQDYMLYFCGLDCYQKWRSEQDQTTDDAS